MALHTRKPVSKPASATSSDMDKVEPLNPYDDDILKLDIDYFMRKIYPEIRDAADELPLVMESINQAMARAGGFYAQHIFKLQSLEAKTYALLRQEWGTRYADKMTEKALEMAVAQDETLIAEKERLAVLKVVIKQLANSQENVRNKLEAMRSVESTRRKLVQDDPEQEN